MVANVISNLVSSPSASTLALGEEGIIGGFTDAQLASKLLSMGVLPGSQIKLIRRAPFGGAVYVSVDEHCLALREVEFAAIAIRQ
ncbi:MAG: FeoA family protein [Bacteroidota bacterium]